MEAENVMLKISCILQMDVESLDERIKKVACRVAEKPYNVRKNRLTVELESFISSLPNKSDLKTCHPEDVLRFLASKDKGGKTQVHVIQCQYLGQTGVKTCGCPVRLAAATIGNIVSQLKSIFHKAGRGEVWQVAYNSGNPAAAPEVSDYIVGVSEEQAEAHVVRQQAKPIFPKKLKVLCEYWKNEIGSNIPFKNRFVFYRDRAFFTLQFFAGDRAYDLSLGQEK